MITCDFAIEEPGSVEAVLQAMSSEDDTVRPLAGGTALVLLMRYGLFTPTRLISLRRVRPALSAVRRGADGSLLLGALATLRELECSPQVAAHAPMLAQALRRVASVRVRNGATLGGHLAHGDPRMDLPPVFIALGAEVRLASIAGERWLPVADLFVGYYETVLEPQELITEVRVPAQGASRGTYRKVTATTVEDWPLLGVAVRAGLCGGRLDDVRVAVGGATDRAQRLPDCEQRLNGARPTAALLQDAADAASHGVRYASGSVSEDYRRDLMRVSVRRALEHVIDGAA